MAFAEILTLRNQSALKFKCFHRLRFTEHLLWTQSPECGLCRGKPAEEKAEVPPGRGSAGVEVYGAYIEL